MRAKRRLKPAATNARKLQTQKALSLLKIFLDPLRLAEQEGDVHLGGGQKLLDRPERCLELLTELFVFLVAPGVAEVNELTVQHAHPVLEFGVELLERLGEPPDLGGVDDGLGHGK